MEQEFEFLTTGVQNALELLGVGQMLTDVFCRQSLLTASPAGF